MELLLIRHGLPERIENVDGSPADPPLSETGHDQARRVAEFLATQQVDRLYSSPMRRAIQTAEPIAASKGLDIEVRDGVAEYDRHSESYIPVEELKTLDRARWESLMQSDFDDAEFAPFAAEVIDSLEAIVADNRGKRVAVACHGGVINVWTAHVIGFKPRLFFNPNYTSINRFMAASSGTKSVITLNEHFHLPNV